MDWRDVGNGHKISVLRLTSTPIKASGSQQNAQPVSQLHCKIILTQ